MKTIVGVYKAKVRVMAGDPQAGGILGTGRDFDHWYSFDPIPWRREDRPTGDTWYVTGGEVACEIILPDGADLVEIESLGRRLMTSETGLAVAYEPDDATPTAIQLPDGRLIGARPALHLATAGRDGFALAPVAPPVVPPSKPAHVPTTEELWGTFEPADGPAPPQGVGPRPRKTRGTRTARDAKQPTLGW